jgi:hypothetical protein
MNYQGKTALITGASGGIGYELSKELAAKGFDVIVVARSKDKLEQVAAEITQKYKVKAHVVVQDLERPAAAQELYDKIQGLGLTVDALVNNAGFGTYGLFAESDFAKQSAMMQVNMVVLTQLTHLFLPAMLKKGDGYIMNVASTASFQAGPLMAVYCATKAYVLSFTEAIANELKGTGIKVSALCPGVTQSGFHNDMAAMQSSTILSTKRMSAEKVAKIGVNGLLANKTVVIAGTTNSLLAFSVRFFPRKMAASTARRLMESRGH